MRIPHRALACVLCCASLRLAAAGLPADARAAIDAKVADVLKETGAPGASLAVVKDGAIVYAKAYGAARLGPPPLAATETMRFSIGSISKQFTASAILLLAEEGKISLDDRVVRWLPGLTRAKDVTVRQLLSMTSGYEDYWPQDYVMPPMRKPVSAAEILDTWARKPLDFEPGTKWQYSNTNYVAAGVIVEKAAGQPLLDFLRARVFGPLGMTSVADTDSAPLGPTDPAGYVRYALGPARLAPKEGKGWMFAAGELAMTASDLARWDLSLLGGTVLSPASTRDLTRDVLLASGAGTRYGLGVGVAVVDGRRILSHGGEVSGFTATNEVYPDDGAAVCVFVNLDATDASATIAKKVREVLFASAGDGREEATAQARKIFEGLQKGLLDRALFTENANAYFSPETLRDFASSLRPLGTPKTFTQSARSLRGGMTKRRFKIAFEKRTLTLTTFTMPDGKLEQYMVAAAE
jgi:D-alanyl-D-alanine carboxypeptidase